MTILITNAKAVRLLHELEALQLIKVLREDMAPAPTKLSGKYKGIISKEQGRHLNEHIKQMRSEWSSI